VPGGCSGTAGGRTRAPTRFCSRASDQEGRTQPARISDPEREEWSEAIESGTFPWNEGGYAANVYVPNAIDVTVTTPE
jgi:hypothetical protein